MFVANTMTHNPVTIYPEAPLTEARALMDREKIHRLPVTDHHGKLVGIISVKDILNMSPSPATTLDRYEMTKLLEGLKVEGTMTKKVITVTEHTPIEEAARLMADNNIGGIPVLRDGSTLVGIITESDLFRLFVDMFGARKPGLRLTLRIHHEKGSLATITRTIAGSGGNIIALGTAPGSDPTNLDCVIKLEGISKAKIRELLGSQVIEIIDAQEI